MTVDDKRKLIMAYCEEREMCGSYGVRDACPLSGTVFAHAENGCPYVSDEYIKQAYTILMEKMKNPLYEPNVVSDFEAVSKPAHYIQGRKYEPKDVIRDWGLNFNLGSAVKYISRAGRKDDILQDLRKAMQFISYEIIAIQKERMEKG